jgi:hypothetical protein
MTQPQGLMACRFRSRWPSLDPLMAWGEAGTYRIETHVEDRKFFLTYGSPVSLVRRDIVANVIFLG